MKPLTLAEVNAAGRVATARVLGAHSLGFEPYDSAEDSYAGFVRIALDARGVKAWSDLRAHVPGYEMDSYWGAPIGFVLERINRILALIPEPE